MMKYYWSSPKSRIIQSRRERDKIMSRLANDCKYPPEEPNIIIRSETMKADNKSFDFIAGIIEEIMKGEYPDGYVDLCTDNTALLYRTRLELWLCFMEQYQLKRTPKTGLLILEII